MQQEEDKMVTSWYGYSRCTSVGEYSVNQIVGIILIRSTSLMKIPIFRGNARNQA